jgi:uncharacterized protein (DUF362 family)
MFEKLKLTEKLKDANYVVIKPNFAAGTYVEADSHVVTDIRLVGRLVEFVLYVDPEKTVYIAESDSTGFGFAFLKFENLKLPESLCVSAETLKHVKLLDMSRDMLKQVDDKRFLHFTNADKQLWLSKTLLEADFIIDATNLKTHSVTGFTGACKNLFGTLPTTEKWPYHTHISEIIHDLVLAVKPTLCIVDAFYGMEYNGPVAGKKVDAGYRVWSTDALAADIVSCRMIEHKPKKVKHLKELMKTIGVVADDVIKATVIDESKVRPFHPPVTFLRVQNRMGLFLQRIGEAIQYFGHRIHVTENLFQLLIAMGRPILMAIFGKERLVAMKRKLLGDKK